MRLSIVIPNYNGEKILEKNFPSVIKSLDAYAGSKELIYVDDGSEDRSVEILYKLAKATDIKTHVVIHKVNKGFSSAVNTGVKEATGDIVILLNTDVRPEKDFIRPLLAHFDNDSVFAVGCMDRSVENGKEVLRGRGVGKWSKGFLMHSAGRLDGTNSLWASGGSSAFRKSVWDRLGGMNELYNPFYWEDIDLSYRALKSGYKVLFEKESIVIHEHETGAIKSQHSEKRISAVAYRNQIQFVWLNITSQKLLLSHRFWLMYLVTRSFFSGDRQLFRGYLMARNNISQIRLIRSKLIKNFVKSDESVLAEHQT